MKNISAEEFKEVLCKEHGNRPLVVDVRTAEEYREMRIPHAVNMPLDEMEKYAETLRPYDIVYVHCRSGHRSVRACEVLEFLGLANLANVLGGIEAWERIGGDIVYGEA
ncbi:MAG: rhodanese-like domain-containing protein [Candidatus Moranbacteria bacterium]|nr:rhodanese-like domain-containing protein [Candidatus Moranbacteria bacterium]